MKDSKGRMRRVRKRYVDVVARMREDGSFEPLSIAWRDGRSFKVTEIVEAGEFRPGFPSPPIRLLPAAPFPAASKACRLA